MIFQLTTNDPDTRRWYDEVKETGHIGWNCSCECESVSIKVDSLIVIQDKDYSGVINFGEGENL